MGKNKYENLELDKKAIKRSLKQLKKTPGEKLEKILTQKNLEAEAYQTSQNFTLFINTINKISSKFFESYEFEKAIKKLNEIFSKNDPGFTDSQKNSLNEKMKDLMSDLFYYIPLDQKMEKEIFESLRNASADSPLYTSALISRLAFENLDSDTLKIISSELDKLLKTHFDYNAGQREIADYYIRLLSQEKRNLTTEELSQFLEHAKHCVPLHEMIDRMETEISKHSSLEKKEKTTKPKTS